MHENAVLEVKKNTSEKFLKPILDYFQDYLVVIERNEEGPLPQGGLILYAAGSFDVKKSTIHFFDPNNTSLEDI